MKVRWLSTDCMCYSYLSSWPRMQVEMKRQQESGQGMILYWPHHLVITILQHSHCRYLSPAPVHYTPHIEAQHKSHRDQISKTLTVNGNLLKLLLHKVNIKYGKSWNISLLPGRTRQIWICKRRRGSSRVRCRARGSARPTCRRCLAIWKVTSKTLPTQSWLRPNQTQIRE